MAHKNDILILIDRHDLNVYDLTQMGLLVVNFNIFRTPLKIAFLGCSVPARGMSAKTAAKAARLGAKGARNAETEIVWVI